tara:strand:+ start:340 stop:1848 length:1509 start_codon:yes stop_codon:yes gene_type:complete
MALTSWWMDIEVYMIDMNSGHLEPAPEKFELGPYQFSHNNIITLDVFLEEINNTNYNLASTTGIPFFYVYATPYTFSNPNPPSPGYGFNVPLGPETHIANHAPIMRKQDIGGPTDIFETISTAQDPAALRQMFIRYDISLYESAGWRQQFRQAAMAAGFPGDLQYYGFKIYWRTGPYTTSIVPTEPLGPYADIMYEQNPDTVAIDLPYSPPVVTTMQDDSPLPPIPRVAPYMGISNKLLIMLNSNTGEYLARPVAILPEDLEKIAQIYLHQKGVSYTPDQVKTLINDPFADENDYAILYMKDDPTTKFEIFRMTEMPTSYDDFNTGQNPHAMVVSNVSYGKQSDGASFVDDIEPNKKYYYCFRSLDVHNNISNPTHVFEVEMMDNEGQVYIILKTIEFSSGPERSYTKPGRRFIYLEPSLRNLTFESTDLLVDPIVPGETLDSITPEDIPPDNILGASLITGPDKSRVWDQMYKIRVTSTKTSRKFDLNLTFKNTGVKNPEG